MFLNSRMICAKESQYSCWVVSFSKVLRAKASHYFYCGEKRRSVPDSSFPVIALVAVIAYDCMQVWDLMCMWNVLLASALCISGNSLRKSGPCALFYLPNCSKQSLATSLRVFLRPLLISSQQDVHSSGQASWMAYVNNVGVALVIGV